MEQQGKVKLFRVLKVVFYCLGLPLMCMSVLGIAATYFSGEAPFAGTSFLPNNIMAKATIPLTGSGLYGVWIALGVWAFIGAMQILFHYVIKNKRARLVAVVSVILVTMLVPVFTIDSVYGKKLEDLAAIAEADGNGVVVEDYMTQLSYYRTLSSSGTPNGRMPSKTDQLVDRVNQVMRDFNIGYGGGSSNGTAGSYNSNPVTYAYLGIDVNGPAKKPDGKVDVYDEIIVKNAPVGQTKKNPGKLVISGYKRLKQDAAHVGKYQAVYDNIQAAQHNRAPVHSITFTADDFEDGPFEYPDFFPIERAKNNGYNDVKSYLWYQDCKMPKEANGMFGKGDYTKNGLLGDGYVFGIDNVLNILAQYYGEKEAIDEAIAKYNAKNPAHTVDFDTVRNELQMQAIINRQDYYENNEDPLQRLLYYREINYFAGDFELGPDKLADVLSVLGGSIGTIFLFDKIADMLSPNIREALNKGGTIKQVLYNLINGLRDNAIVGLVAPMLVGETWDDTGAWMKYDELDGAATALPVDSEVITKREALKWANNGEFDFEPFIDKNNDGWYTKGIDEFKPEFDLDGDGEWTHEALEFNAAGKKMFIHGTRKDAEGKIKPRDIGVFGGLFGDGTAAHPSKLAGLGLDDAVLSIVYNKDKNMNGVWDEGDEYYDGEYLPGVEDPADPFHEQFVGLRIVFRVNTAQKGETYKDENNNGKYDEGEAFADTNLDKVYNPADPNPIYKGVVLNIGSDLSLDHLQPILDNAIEIISALLHIDKATIDSLLGLVGGLLPVDLGNLTGSIMDLLAGIYWYQSPDILPTFSAPFYKYSNDFSNKLGLGVDANKNEDLAFIAEHMALYDAAEYAGAKHGTAIGSELIAKSEAAGLNSLQAVQQLQMDLSYKPDMYPVLAARDMLLVFAGLSVFWTILAYICAEKEQEYATGTAPEKKAKNKKKNSKSNSKKGFAMKSSKSKKNVSEDKTKIPDSENNEKEVK